MAVMDDLLRATLTHRAQDSQSARADKIESLQAKIAESSGKLRLGGLSTVFKVVTEMVGSSGHGQKGLKLLSPYLALAALTHTVFNGIAGNRDLNAKLAALEQQNTSSQPSGPGLTPV